MPASRLALPRSLSPFPSRRGSGQDKARQAYWRTAMAESQRLGDEFLELVETGRLGDVLQAL